MERTAENKAWIRTWALDAWFWAQSEGTPQNRKNCEALLDEVNPDWRVPFDMWNQFIEHLNRVQPLGRPDKEGKTLPHMSFIGSIESYRKVFLQASK